MKLCSHICILSVCVKAFFFDVECFVKRLIGSAAVGKEGNVIVAFGDAVTYQKLHIKVGVIVVDVKVELGTAVDTVKLFDISVGSGNHLVVVVVGENLFDRCVGHCINVFGKIVPIPAVGTSKPNECGDLMIVGDLVHIKSEVKLGHRAGNGRDNVFTRRKRNLLEYLCNTAVFGGSADIHGMLTVICVNGNVVFLKRIAFENVVGNYLFAMLNGNFNLFDSFVAIVGNVELLVFVNLIDNENANEIGMNGAYFNGAFGASREEHRKCKDQCNNRK